jgi:hypothetical protein
MAEGAWVFEREPPMGGASTAAWLNPLTGSELSSEEVLAREAIQNSCDAQIDDRNVLIKFSRQTLTGESAAGFIDALKLHEGPIARLQVLGLPADNTLARIAAGDGELKLELLYIEDFETRGLGGRIEEGWEPEDRFRRLCLWLGIEDRAEESSSRGGSFGYGKSVYAGNSDVRTVVFYSVFAPTEETRGITARLFTCSFFGAHAFDGKRYTGRAWYGLRDSTREDACWPLEDEDAHQTAERLGFSRRAAEQTGTSILIVGAKVDMDRLRAGIETYWWPRIRDQDLTVQLFDDGRLLPSPRPLQRSDLGPFIRCYEILSGRAQADSEQGERLRRLNRSGPFELGELALKRVEPASRDVENGEDMAHTRRLLNSVALVRGPRMVVEYYPVGYEGLEPIVGVFVGHEDIEATLRLSEPPAHNCWDPDNRRLESYQEKIVRSVLDRIYRQARDFQQALQPPPPPQVGRVTALEKLLAKFMKSKTQTQPPSPPRSSDPFEIHIKQSRVANGDQATVAAEIKLALKNDAVMENLAAKVTVRTSVLANDNLTVDEHIPIEELELIAGTGSVDAGAGFVTVELNKNDPVTIAARSSAFEADWVANLAVSVESLTQSENEES